MPRESNQNIDKKDEVIKAKNKQADKARWAYRKYCNKRDSSSYDNALKKCNEYLELAQKSYKLQVPNSHKSIENAEALLEKLQLAQQNTKNNVQSNEEQQGELRYKKALAQRSTYREDCRFDDTNNSTHLDKAINKCLENIELIKEIEYPIHMLESNLEAAQEQFEKLMEKANRIKLPKSGEYMERFNLLMQNGNANNNTQLSDCEYDNEGNNQNINNNNNNNSERDINSDRRIRSEKLLQAYATAASDELNKFFENSDIGHLKKAIVYTRYAAQIADNDIYSNNLKNLLKVYQELQDALGLSQNNNNHNNNNENTNNQQLNIGYNNLNDDYDPRQENIELDDNSNFLNNNNNGSNLNIYYNSISNEEGIDFSHNIEQDKDIEMYCDLNSLNNNNNVNNLDTYYNSIRYGNVINFDSSSDQQRNIVTDENANFLNNNNNIVNNENTNNQQLNIDNDNINIINVNNSQEDSVINERFYFRNNNNNNIGNNENTNNQLQNYNNINDINNNNYTQQEYIIINNNHNNNHNNGYDWNILF